MKPSIYIETSVISYYCGRNTDDPIINARQMVTRNWWKHSLGLFQPHISPVVIDEIKQGNPDSSQQRLNSINGIPILKPIPEVLTLAELIYSELKLPGKAQQDVLHIAFSIVHSMDYLVSWNCKHIANGWVIKQLEKILEKRRLPRPTICTPDELQEASNER